MDSSAALRDSAKTAARSAAEAGVLGGLALLGACAVWTDPAQRQGLWIGGVCAWAASSVSTTALLAAKAAGGLKAFWWAFGGGMALRMGALCALMAYGWGRESVEQPALLLSYAFGVLFFLLLEYRHIKLK